MQLLRRRHAAEICGQRSDPQPRISKEDQEENLHLSALGIRQDSQREFTLVVSFAISLGVIAAAPCAIGSLDQCYNFGGPVSCVWNWLVVAFFTMFIGLSMAEIASGLPAAGGPFFWATWLAGKYGPLAGWVTGVCGALSTGYLNLLGVVGISALVAHDALRGAALVVSWTKGVEASRGVQLIIYAGVLVVAAGMNSLSSRMLTRWTAFSLFWTVFLVVFTLALELDEQLLLIPTVAPWHQNAAFVFGGFRGWQQSTSGITNNVYLVMQGSLMSTYVFSGYDAPGHVCEETVAARSAAPMAILWSLAASYAVGILLVIGLLFCVQDPDGLMTGSANGAAGYQIIFDAFRARFGTQTWGVIFLLVPVFSSFMCLILALASNARMIFAFARDGGLPFSAYFAKVSASTKTPRRAVWLAVLIALVMGAPMASSDAAFYDVFSIITIGLQVSYGIPIVCKMTVGRKLFQPGPFSLGRHSMTCNAIAVCWVVVSAVPMMMPNVFPVTVKSFNFAPVALTVVLVLTVGAWVCPYVGARHWFKGHRHGTRLMRTQRIRNRFD